MTAPDGPRPQGLGDRWLAGEAIEGVRFAQGDRVRVRDGRHAGRDGRILLLADAPPHVAYLVEFGDARPARLPQAALEPGR